MTHLGSIEKFTGVCLKEMELRVEAKSEKGARGTFFSAVQRLLSKNDIVIADGMNYIKGFRYQLFCEAKAQSTPHCVVCSSVFQGWTRRYKRELRQIYAKNGTNHIRHPTQTRSSKNYCYGMKNQIQRIDGIVRCSLSSTMMRNYRLMTYGPIWQIQRRNQIYRRYKGQQQIPIVYMNLRRERKMSSRSSCRAEVEV